MFPVHKRCVYTVVAYLKPIMASETGKQHARYTYKFFLLFHWIPFVIMLVIDILGIVFAKSTSGYWGGGLAVAVMSGIVAAQSTVLFRWIRDHDKNDLRRRKFADMFNWQGLNIILCMGACIAGIAVAASLGASYGKNDNHDDEANSTSSEPDQSNDDKNYVNVKENQVIGILIAVFSGMTLLAMGRSICLHGEVRTVLGIPEKPTAPPPDPKPAPQPKPQPKPAAKPKAEPKPSQSKKPQETDEEIKILTTQNNLLKEQNQIQKDQLEQMKALNQHLQRMSASQATGSIPPPPAYHAVAGFCFPGESTDGTEKT